MGRTIEETQEKVRHEYLKQSRMVEAENTITNRRLRHRYISDQTKQLYLQGVPLDIARRKAVEGGVAVGFLHYLWKSLTEHGAKSLRIKYKCR